MMITTSPINTQSIVDSPRSATHFRKAFDYNEDIAFKAKLPISRNRWYAAWSSGAVPIPMVALLTSTPRRSAVPSSSRRAVYACPQFAAYHSGVSSFPYFPTRYEALHVKPRVGDVEVPELRQGRQDVHPVLQAKTCVDVQHDELSQVPQRLEAALQVHAPAQVKVAELAKVLSARRGCPPTPRTCSR